MNDEQDKQDARNEKRKKVYTLRLTPEELARYHKARGKVPLSKLIKQLLEAYIRNPNILDPTVVSGEATIPKETEKKIDEVVNLLLRREQRDQEAEEDRKVLRRLATADLKQQGMPLKDIHALLEGRNQSGEAIFKKVSEKGGTKHE